MNWKTRNIVRKASFSQMYTTATDLKERLGFHWIREPLMCVFNFFIVIANSPNVRRRPTLQWRVSAEMLSMPTHIALVPCFWHNVSPPTHAAHNSQSLPPHISKREYQFDSCISLWRRRCAMHSAGLCWGLTRCVFGCGGSLVLSRSGQRSSSVRAAAGSLPVGYLVDFFFILLSRGRKLRSPQAYKHPKIFLGVETSELCFRTKKAVMITTIEKLSKY